MIFSKIRAFVIPILMTLSTTGWCQTVDSISVQFTNLPLEIILDSISHKSGYDFSYNAEIIPHGSLYTYKNEGVLVDDFLNILFVGTGLEFTKIQNQIIIKRSNPENIELIPDQRISIAGWVRETGTKQPIEGVNVYIQGSTIGTTTDKYGNYRLTNLSSGNYVVVFSHIGYMTGSYNLKGENDIKFVVNALLESRVETLLGVEIVSEKLVNKTFDRLRHFNTFKRELLGTSNNALFCEIENPEVLDYVYNEGKNFLQVIASEPIIVNNMALGYKIILDLDYFNKETGELNFHGQARYEPLVPESRKIRKRWKRNRMTAYNGSMIHFFTSLVNNNYVSEGYRIGIIEDLSESSAVTSIKRKELMQRDQNSRDWLLTVDDYLFIEYSREPSSNVYLKEVEGSLIEYPEAAVFKNQSNNVQIQRSLVKLKNGSVLVDKDGKIQDRLSVVSFGYWSWERLGDLMPIDYDPKRDIF
ncbi:MAG: hypothetical protein ACJA08_003014 [Cyclobacteriaceae bacterium]|jgi:hypothetical protein